MRAISAQIIAVLVNALLASAAALTAAGCSGDSFTVVLVKTEARSSMRPANLLEVSGSNGEDTFTEQFDIQNREFPLTFTVTPSGRTGDISFEIRAVDSTGDQDLLRGQGSGRATIVENGRVDVEVMLEPVDFVVNSSVDGSQALTFEPESNGKQVAVLPDGSFLIAFLNDCANLGLCDVHARLFAADTQPARNGISGDSSEFTANQLLSQNQIGSPVTAAGQSSVLIAWASNGQIRGTLLDTNGAPIATDIAISDSRNTAKSPHAAALASGQFVVVWREDIAIDQRTIVARLVESNGTLSPDGVFTTKVDDSERDESPIVASTRSGRGFVVIWHDASNVFGQFFDSTGTAINTEQNLTKYESDELTVYGPHVAWVGDAAMLIWGVYGDEATFEKGRLLMRRFGPDGNTDGAESVILTATDDSFAKPAMVSRNDGVVAVAWHSCEGRGDDSGCGVFVRFAYPSGLPIGRNLRANTTTSGDQKDASIATADIAMAAADDAIAAKSGGFVVAWNDRSDTEPNESNGAVRARMVYPEIGVANGRIGAPCRLTDDAGCESGLVCTPGSGKIPRCHRECTPGESDQCLRGGLCNLVRGSDRGACIF
ncbi:MAG: hypothetical protein MJE77_33710 [Proteobacteria bacterium]|nr:hypothetical protein [Pseudomonadota bacterium]